MRRGEHASRSWLPGLAAEQSAKGGDYFRGQGGEAGCEVREGVSVHGGRRCAPVFNHDVGFDVALRLTPTFSR